MGAGVLPWTPVFPVGGVAAETVHAWIEAGADGFGLGSALAPPGRAPEEGGRRAYATVTGYDALVSEQTILADRS